MRSKNVTNIATAIKGKRIIKKGIHIARTKIKSKRIEKG